MASERLKRLRAYRRRLGIMRVEPSPDLSSADLDWLLRVAEAAERESDGSCIDGIVVRAPKFDAQLRLRAVLDEEEP